MIKNRIISNELMVALIKYHVLNMKYDEEMIISTNIKFDIYRNLFKWIFKI